MFLALVHLRDAACTECGAPLAVAGARSFVVGTDGDPFPFDENDQPADMTVEIPCENAHVTTLYVPNEIAAEDVLQTPEDAPQGRDALLISGSTEGGKQLTVV